MAPAVLVTQGYIPFIHPLAAYYPGVTVALVSSPILGDMYPTPTDMQLTQHRAAIAPVVACHAGGGGLPVAAGDGTGASQQAMAASQVATVLRSAMGW